ncbi:Peroxin-5 [Lachancea thermotolerans]
MSADCSVGSNPLASLNKHAQQDRSLHHGGGLRLNNEAAQRFKSQDSVVSDASRARMEAFMGQEHMDHPMMLKGPRPMLSRPLQESSQQARESWSKQFSSSPALSMNQSPELHSPTSQVPSIAYQKGLAAGNTEGSQVMRARVVGPRYGPGLASGMFNPMSHQTAQQPVYRHSSPQSHMSMNQESWDEQFKELEKEVSEKLALHEEEMKPQAAAAEQDVVEDQYQAEFQEVWDNLQEESQIPDAGGDVETDWQREYQQYISGRPSDTTQYRFETENQYLHNSNAYEIGCILMENGAKLSEAALAFEAAVQEDPSHVDAWLKLGMVQTQNEMEYNGIGALEECLRLDPRNLDGMVTLAISYINEGYDVSAFKMLNKWLETKYPDMVAPNEALEKSTDRYSMNQAITLRFLQVVNKLPQVDASLQLGLGILFYSNDDYDKTVDCFRAALAVKPDDELMWNRLGASLANSNRSEEAIQAYRKALQLKPTFVRARCNLAVSCMNMGCFKEAAEYLLTALSMHEVEGILPSETPASSNLIETLKRAFIGMERRDLLEKVRPNMDLAPFRNEFNF